MGHDSNEPTIYRLPKMNRRAALAAWVAVTLSMPMAGCQNLTRGERGQSPEAKLFVGAEPFDTSKTNYVARVCKMSGLNFQKIEGVAVVTNLDQTGSAAKPGSLRKRLLRDLETIDLPEAADRLLESKNTEMVLVRGFLPPGIKEGDPFDLELISLNDTDATSLQGGYLQKVRLRTTAKLGGTVRDGHLHGLGRGRVLTNATFETRDDVSNKLSGVVLAGGTSKIDRNLTLIIRNGSGSIRTSTAITGAINLRFTVSTSAGLEGVANSKTDQVIELKIPQHYRYNVGRYAQVISNIAYGEDVQVRVNRIDELEQQLQNPITTGLAAIRLEAIGKQALPMLKRALQFPDPQVQFAAAQSLAYFDMPDGIDILVESARNEPVGRWQALTALTTLDSARADEALESLLIESSAETRYGAFRAIRLKNPRNPIVVGRQMNNEFRLCIVDNGSPPMLHFTKSETAEITLFNDSQTVSDKFLFVRPGLTVKANGDGTVAVTSYSTESPFRATCGDRVSDVITTMVDAGCDYATILKMSRNAKKEDMLNTRLVVDATPKIKRTYGKESVKKTIANAQQGVRGAAVATKLKGSTDTIKDASVKPAAWLSNVKERFAR